MARREEKIKNWLLSMEQMFWPDKPSLCNLTTQQLSECRETIKGGYNEDEDEYSNRIIYTFPGEYRIQLYNNERPYVEITFTSSTRHDILFRLSTGFGDLQACGNTMISFLHSNYFGPVPNNFIKQIAHEIDARLVYSVLLMQRLNISGFGQKPGYVLGADKYQSKEPSNCYMGIEKLHIHLPELWENIWNCTNPYHDFKSKQGLYARRIYDDDGDLIFPLPFPKQ